MKLSNLTARQRTVTVDIEGESLTLTVQPYLMTPEVEREINRGTEESVDALMDFICRYIVEWDVVDEADQPIELKPDTVAALMPSNIILLILQKAREVTDPLAQQRQTRRR